MLSFSLFILLFLRVVQSNSSIDEVTPQCGELDVFKDEKCIKVFDSMELLSFNEAQKKCSKYKNSKLISIHSREENEFIISLLYNKYNLRANVWLGAQFRDNVLKWRDNSSVNFTNLVHTRVINDDQYSCLQLSLNFGSSGKWTLENCEQKNAIVVCEKNQSALFLYFQKQLTEIKVSLENSQNELKEYKTRQEYLEIRENFSNQILESEKFNLNLALNDYRDEIIQNFERTNNTLENFKTTLTNSIDEMSHKLTANITPHFEMPRCGYGKDWINCRLFIDYLNDIRQVVFLPERVNELTWKEGKCLCEKYNSSLVSIESNEKQKFLEGYIKSNSTLIWTSGHKNLTENWVWSNGDAVNYINRNKTETNQNFTKAAEKEICLHFNGKRNNFISLNEVECSSRLLIVCQFELNNKAPIGNQLWEYAFEYIEQKIIPQGFIYIQLPRQAEPTVLWPNFVWKIISTEYAGHFFRVEGGNALEFGQSQSDAFQGHQHSYFKVNSTKGTYYDGNKRYYDTGYNTVTRIIINDGINGEPRVSNETRPINYSTRVWKRIQ